jgi:flagellar motor switch/type III secretory pathway protein FliN
MTDQRTSAGDPWEPVLHVQADLTLELNVPNLRVADLLKLGSGAVLNTGWKSNQDLPLRVNGKLLAWVEFDAADENMAVRLTEFAWERSV